LGSALLGLCESEDRGKDRGSGSLKDYSFSWFRNAEKLREFHERRNKYYRERALKPLIDSE